MSRGLTECARQPHGVGAGIDAGITNTRDLGGTRMGYSKYRKKTKDRGSEKRSGRETEARSVQQGSLGQKITPGWPTIPFFSRATPCSI